jgi:hypothetical protein
MRVATARAGIEVDAQIYLADTREELRLDVYHQAEATFAEARQRIAKAPSRAQPEQRPARDGRLRTIEPRS